VRRQPLRQAIPARHPWEEKLPRICASATSASFRSVSWISRPCGATRTRDRAWVPNFGSFPYNNTANGNLPEFRFSPQNSRIGFRIDGDWKGAHFIGYNEFDFNGTSGSTAIAVSNGAFVPRLRLFWVDARKDKVEFLAGQSWNMLTPNRNGISTLPGDLFYTQVIDINYMAGLTWTRQPGLRVLYHPNSHVTFGFSAEQPDQYIGGSAGGSGITLPSALTGLASTQLDAAANISRASLLAQPTVTPDFIAKIAIDYSRVPPRSRRHL
jgi:hypothetical protein